jgi:hypothetical protein
VTGAALTIALPAGATLTLPAEGFAALEAALRQHRKATQPQRDVPAEIEASLRASPATLPEIARAIGARDSTVRQILQTDAARFRRVPAPAGRSPRAKLWSLASSPPGVGLEAGTSAGNDRQSTPRRALDRARGPA